MASITRLWFQRRMEEMTTRRRLAVLVLVPVACVAIVAVPLTRDRVQLARAGAAVEATAAHLARVVGLRSSIQAERLGAEATMQGEALGLSPDEVSRLRGFDVPGWHAEADQRTDRATTAFAGDAPPIDPAELRAVRAGVAGAGPGRIPEVLARYDALDHQVRAVMTRTLDEIEEAGTTGSSSAGLKEAIDAVRAGTELGDALDDALRSLQQTLLDGPTDARRVALANAQARVVTSAARLDRLRDAGPARGWDAIARSPRFNHVLEAIDEVVHARTPDPGLADDASRLAGISRDGVEALRQVFGYVDDAGAAIRNEAATSAREATSELAVTFGGALALLLFFALLANRLSQPVRSLLRRLADSAEAVSAGRLDIEPIGIRGPRDLAALTGAFDDLVANLRLLEAKAGALAACNFDAPVLGTTVPGALGDSLRRSVQVLSGSIVERDELQRHLAHQATHDVLTGLPNRAAVTTALDQALRRAQRLGGSVAVLFIDLDEFKPVNDLHGHAVGDEVLRTVATRLAALVRESDYLARIGGDEFVVVTEAADDAAGVADLAERLVAGAAEPIVVGDLSVQVGASVGIAFALDGTEDTEQLLTCADLAVYRAKEHGRGRVEIYDPRMQEELVARAEIRDALTHAIRNGELYLDYQPVFTADSSTMCGVEALVRWDRPGMGLQPPDAFIPQAEESPRLIVELDCWVLDEAARQLKVWQDDPDIDHLHMAVNISGRHLAGRDLVAHVAEVIERRGIDPHRLVLEITETVLLHDLDVAAGQLAQLRAMGIRIAIDDFGTGYTSVTHLAHLPVDVLKIDRSFLTDRLDAPAAKLLAMMIDLGHHLGLDITAEGVETAEQLQILRGLTCDQTQGFLLGRPQPPDGIPAAGAGVAPVGDA